ncbi:uncharacterized protein BJ212DRAFT_1366194 [Suillus subaureus]|uniref:Uncharacterized protein n=1 Tax=Suillus subaureus TaxID=48587 RepID=A0A9P7E7S6_9AGAM|nr:uncharacterized protein BJ212DRAFT_1366194 [Suillus subaureus]KAG1813625.1 hypothetical protein BJ212DRAFT_1366194 [Suillus subaureus]
MKLTLLASLVVLCGVAFAVPPLRRDDGTLVSVIAYVEDVLDNATVTVAKRDDGSLVGVTVDVQDVLNNLSVNVLTKRDDVEHVLDLA